MESSFGMTVFPTVHYTLGAAFGRNRIDPADFKSVVRVILHYLESEQRTPLPSRAPTRRALVAVERMILHYAHRLVPNHCLHRDELGGGRALSRDGRLSAKSKPPPR
jgi:hypothetical protein